jgi:hypothetical protein
MRPAETIATLASHEHRGAGTDSERRAANRLAANLNRDRVYDARNARLEPFWCRPNWALAHAWHVALGLAGSLVAESEPRVGAALLLVALLSLLADATLGFSLGRRLTPERASQNVVSEPDAPEDQVHLIITANYDAGRTGLVYRDPARRAAATLARLTGRISPGWQGWLAVALLWLVAIAILRLEGHKGTAIGIAQLIPTVGLVLALALLLELASAGFGPAANDNATGVAAAVALVGALDVAPPRRLAVDLVLQGAGDGDATGLRRHLYARRKARRAPNTVVLGIAACGAGAPRWWYSDGSLIPVGYFKQLRRLAAQVGGTEPGLQATAHRGRGTTPALPARLRRLPAITIGDLEPPGVAPRSHQAADTPDRVDHEAVDRLVEFGLLLVDSIDAFIATRDHARGTDRPRRAAKHQAART